MIRQVSLTLSLWFTPQTTQQLHPTVRTYSNYQGHRDDLRGLLCKASRESIEKLPWFKVHYVLIQETFHNIKKYNTN